MSSTITQTIQFSKETLLKAVPKEAFQKPDSSALGVIAKVGLSVTLSYALLISSPASLVPISWILVGTALSGLITIAHDCGHNSFFESEKKNQLVGTLAFLPLLYPLESWKLHHNVHHKHAEERSTTGHHQQKPKKLSNALLWPYYVGSYLLRYFDLSQFSREQQAKSRTSVLAVYGFAVVLFGALFYAAGPWGIVKYWAIPWLIVHFWKNTLRTYLMGVIDWKAQKLVHYRYPKWVEFLCCDANFLIPHYLSTEIPTYNARFVHDALMKSEWGKYIEQRSWFQLLEDPNKEQKGQKLRDQPKKFKVVPFIRSLNWLHIPLLLGLPIIGAYGLFSLPVIHPHTLAFAFLYYLFSGLGITAGYHRLWAHRAYEATWPVRFGLMLAGTAAVEGSIRWWCRDHRAHHRYTDTYRDPYSAKEGFWYAHIGWMLVKQNPKNIGFADISDLNADSMIRWQHRNYLLFASFMSFGLPALVCGLGWGDYWGGLYIAGILRLVFVHHATFFVNSLAHTVGGHTYSDKHTPRDSIITALLTFGEGYHNFHHEFPNDYRNGIKFYHYDPTKWLIRGLAFFGLTFDLKEFPDNEIQKGKAQMVQKKIDTIRAKLQWGPEVSSLPLWDIKDLEKAQANGKKLIVIEGVVHDLTVFANNHPGGNIIKSYLGMDATAAFYGGVYDHSNAAINLLSTMRLARIESSSIPTVSSSTQLSSTSSPSLSDSTDNKKQD